MKQCLFCGKPLLGISHWYTLTAVNHYTHKDYLYGGTVNDISKKAYISSEHVRKVLTDLIGLGLVRSSRIKDVRVQYYYFITTAGRELLGKFNTKTISQTSKSDPTTHSNI